MFDSPFTEYEERGGEEKRRALFSLPQNILSSKLTKGNGKFLTRSHIANRFNDVMAATPLIFLDEAHVK